MESGLQYDPLEAPEPEEWLAIDEAERIHLAQDYHRRTRVRLPNEKLHAVFHVVVENQIALGDEMPVQSTVQRLMAEDLDRHEAIHAIASVLAEFMHDLVKKPGSTAKSNQAYFAALQLLTAEGWLDSLITFYHRSLQLKSFTATRAAPCRKHHHIRAD